MCGIAGSVNSALSIEDVSLINHRGPDNISIVKAVVAGNDVYLGHTRLSIQDLSDAGNQPMYTACGNYCIVFNGEIYNHLQLREKLSHVKFRGHSDTETILYYLKEYGIKGVAEFNGIFAFAFLDKLQRKLYLVRDHFGVKPLYYYQNGNCFIFGSEIKIIKNNIAYKRDIDLKALNSFLTLRYNPSPQTLFKNIRKLEASTYLEYNFNGNIAIENYWAKEQRVDYSINEHEAILEYQRLLKQSVERQLLSDVPVGLLLSGGLDSAVLGYLMSEISADKIKTFSIGFQGKGNFNEIEDARMTASFIGSDHHDLFMDKKQYLDFFYKSFLYTEEPIASPTIPALFYVSELASKHVKVVLSGQGADEPMAGYKRYRGEKLISNYQNFLSFLPLPLISRMFPNNSSIERGIYSSQFKDELERFIGIYTIFTPELKAQLFKKDITGMIEEDQKQLFAKNYKLTDPSSDSLSRLLFLDTRSMLPDNLLLFNDKITMANSIENRVPYLDIDLINFIESLPVNLKLRGAKGKYIHRKAAEKWLPKSIIARKKRAFETPISEWFKHELGKSLYDLVENPNSFSEKYFNKEFIKKMISLHMNNKKDYQIHLFILLSLELWYRNFYLQSDNYHKHSSCSLFVESV